MSTLHESPPSATPDRDGAAAPRRTSRRLRRTLAVAAAAAIAAGAIPFAGAAAASAAPDAARQAPSATPDVAALAGPLAEQQLAWEDCGFGDTIPAEIDTSNVLCATVQVPRDWKNPDPAVTWDIRISQAKNIEVDDPRAKGTIFVNPGGPGGSGLPWSAAMQSRATDLRPYYNFVGFDPRGVGQSSLPECEYEFTPDAADPLAELKAAGRQCSKDPDVRTISTEQTTYDMDFIRHLLGAPKLDYIGYSYGTWLGTWYANVFGEHAGRVLLDSSIDGTAATLEGTWDLQPIARDRQFRLHMLNWIARQDATYGLGGDPKAIWERYFAATEEDPETAALVWFLLGGASAFSSNAAYPLAGETVAAIIEAFEAPAEPAPEARSAAANPAQTAAAVLDRIDPAVAGDAEVTEARASLDALAAVPTAAQQDAQRRSATEPQPETGVFSDVFEMIRCNDGQWTQGERYWEARNADLAAEAPLSAQWGLLTTPICAFWQTNTLMPVADDSFPESIVVQSELDSQTGWEGARIAGTALPSTSFIAVDNEGSHGVFPYGTEEVDRPITDYFLDGTQPADITVTQALPLPEEDVVFESWAKLDANAEHQLPDFTDPNQPAESGTANGASTAGQQLLADLQTEQLLRSGIRSIYGEAGVEAVLAARG